MEMPSTAGFSTPPTRSGVDELARCGLHHRLHPRGDAKLAARPLDVEVDSTFTETQNLGDLSRGFTSRRPGQCFEFPLNEVGAQRLPLDAGDASQASLDQRAKHLEVDGFGHVIVGSEPPRRKLRIAI